MARIPRQAPSMPQAGDDGTRCGAARVLVTRPQPDAGRWVARLQARGLVAQALPLIGIRALPESRALVAARAALGRYAAVMFVSRPAVMHFLDAKAAVAWPPGVRAWATGPGTARALTEAGVPAAQLDAPDPGSAQFDSEALWALVASRVGPGQRYLLVRGVDDASGASATASAQESSADSPPAAEDAEAGNGRDWLPRQLAARGAEVEALAVYARTLPDWGPEQRALAAAGGRAPAIWLFTSARAVLHLQQVMAGSSWRSACALATHPRVALAAQAAGFGRVVGTRPDLDSVGASIKSLE